MIKNKDISKGLEKIIRGIKEYIRMGAPKSTAVLEPILQDLTRNVNPFIGQPILIQHSLPTKEEPLLNLIMGIINGDGFKLKYEWPYEEGSFNDIDLLFPINTHGNMGVIGGYYFGIRPDSFSYKFEFLRRKKEKKLFINFGLPGFVKIDEDIEKDKIVDISVCLRGFLDIPPGLVGPDKSKFLKNGFVPDVQVFLGRNIVEEYMFNTKNYFYKKAYCRSANGCGWNPSWNMKMNLFSYLYKGEDGGEDECYFKDNNYCPEDYWKRIAELGLHKGDYYFEPEPGVRIHVPTYIKARLKKSKIKID